MRNITLWLKRKSQVHKDVYNGHNQILKLLISGREVKENEFKASEKKKNLKKNNLRSRIVLISPRNLSLFLSTIYLFIFFLLISNKLSKINIENSQRVINTERKAALALNSHQGYRLELHAQLARIPPILSFISLINNS